MARRRREYYENFWKNQPYVSVAEKRKKAEIKLAQLKKKNPAIKPVIIEGSAIAASWWGKSWNKNLEGYADYSNRIGRGRSYVRHGAVLDLQIKPGEVSALVQGSTARPYEVTINIDPIAKRTWNRLTKESEGKLDSLPGLLAGKFPKAIGELFTERGKGLFPTPKEIRFSCSCPDMASMCKHVAAALYGVSARMDEEPALFFTLRNAELEELVSRAVKSKSEELLKKAEKKSSRVIEDMDLSAIFGIQLDENPGLAAKENLLPAPPPAAVKKPAAPKKKKSSPPAPAREKTGDSPVERVTAIIMDSKEGADVIELKHKTGLDTKIIRGIISKLKREGKIMNIARGFYIGNPGE